MSHTLVALIDDKPGALNRVVSQLRRQRFHIASLSMGKTEQENISRLTIVAEGDDNNVEHLIRYIETIVDVIQVDNLSSIPAITRDLAMVKVNTNNENRLDVLKLVETYRARIVDVSDRSVIIEILDSEENIEAFVSDLRPMGIIEMARTGIVAMARGLSSFPFVQSYEPLVLSETY